MNDFYTFAADLLARYELSTGDDLRGFEMDLFQALQSMEEASRVDTEQTPDPLRRLRATVHTSAAVNEALALRVVDALQREALYDGPDDRAAIIQDDGYPYVAFVTANATGLLFVTGEVVLRPTQAMESGKET